MSVVPQQGPQQAELQRTINGCKRRIDQAREIGGSYAWIPLDWIERLIAALSASRIDPAVPSPAEQEPQGVNESKDEARAMESGSARRMGSGGLDRPTSDVGGVPVAPDAPPYEGPRGTYNCPICGWNVPHREHAGEVIEQLCIELTAWKEWWQHVVLMLKSGIRPGCSVSQAKLNCDELVAGRGATRPAPFISPMFDKQPFIPPVPSPGGDTEAQLKLIEDILRRIESAYRGSIGSIENTYMPQIGVDEVVRWRARLAAAVVQPSSVALTPRAELELAIGTGKALADLSPECLRGIRNHLPFTSPVNGDPSLDADSPTTPPDILQEWWAWCNAHPHALDTVAKRPAAVIEHLWSLLSNTWRPIETAKRGEMVLLYARGWRHPFAGTANGDFGACWIDGDPGFQMHGAQMWMPLPSASSASAAADQARP